MKEELFEELVVSLQEGGKILRAEAAPSHSFVVKPIDVPNLTMESTYAT